MILLIRDWISIALFKKSVATVAKEATMTSGFVNYLVAGIITIIVSLIIILLVSITSAIGLGTGIGAGIATGIVLVFALGFMYVILWPAGIIISLILLAISQLVAKLLGGTGSYTKTVGTIWTVGAAITVTYSLALQIISGIIQIIGGFLGPVGSLISVMLGIITIPVTLIVAAISIYLTSKSIAEVHNIETWKGFVALIVPTILLLLIIAFLVVIALVVVGLSLQSMSSGYFSFLQ